MKRLLFYTIAALAVNVMGRPTLTKYERLPSENSNGLSLAYQLASTAPSINSTVWDPPRDMVSDLEQAWKATTRLWSKPLYNDRFLIPKLMANNGSINYCVVWDTNKAVTAPQRARIARALQSSMQEWFNVLVGFDGFPLTDLDVNVVSYAAKSVHQFHGDTTGLDINTSFRTSKGAPRCDPRCYRADFAESIKDMSACPGGKKTHYDMALTLQVLPQPDPKKFEILGLAVPDGQYMHPLYLLNHSDDENMEVLRHEVGHSFGLVDRTDRTPKRDDSIMMGSNITHVTEFDAWMLRDWWRKLRVRHY